MSYFNNGFENRRRGSKIFWITIGIFGFLLVFFPFFGGFLKLQIGTVVHLLIFTIGQFSLIIGVFLFIWGFFGLLCSRRKLYFLKPLILGVLMLIVGAYITGFELIPFLPGIPRPPEGYY